MKSVFAFVSFLVAIVMIAAVAISPAKAYDNQHAMHYPAALSYDCGGETPTAARLNGWAQAGTNVDPDAVRAWADGFVVSYDDQLQTYVVGQPNPPAELGATLFYECPAETPEETGSDDPVVSSQSSPATSSVIQRSEPVRKDEIKAKGCANTTVPRPGQDNTQCIPVVNAAGTVDTYIRYDDSTAACPGWVFFAWYPESDPNQRRTFYLALDGSDTRVLGDICPN